MATAIGLALGISLAVAGRQFGFSFRAAGPIAVFLALLLVGFLILYTLDLLVERHNRFFWLAFRMHSHGDCIKERIDGRLRAAVDDSRVARGLGINVNRIFALTFAFGSGLAGLGGALGAEILGLDPTFPLKFMIYFLIVVTVGGTSSITGPFLASLLLGIGDVAGKYYVPTLGSFVIYTIMIVILIWRPQGLFARAVSR